MRRMTFLMPTAVLLATPVLADAVTYSGKLGTADIVVELSAPPQSATGPLVGRYAYLRQGVDIPLTSSTIASGAITLSEEAPCTPETCRVDDHGNIPHPPQSGTWKLKATGDGASLSGTWTGNGKTFDIALTRRGARALPQDTEITPQILVDSIGAPLTLASAPYDVLKMQVPLTKSPETRWGEVAFQYVTDPRTKFAYPRIASLAGTNPTLANAYLQERHWSMNVDAFTCASTQFAGFGWDPYLGPNRDSLGGYEDENIDVTALSPTLMSWTESGSLFCGGAHPYNHSNILNLDIRTGTPLDLSQIFAGWVPVTIGDSAPVDLETARQNPGEYYWQADQTLIDFVRAHRSKSAIANTPSDCNMNELIGQYLAIGFRQTDQVVFSLGSLPNVIQACAEDLYQSPITELTDLLAPGAANYFPVLKTTRTAN